MPLAAAFLSASVLAQPVAGTGPRHLAQSYDLGTVTIEQLSQAPGSRFRQMPVGLRGVIAVPADPGPHPVALFIHGSCQLCDAAVIRVAGRWPFV